MDKPKIKERKILKSAENLCRLRERIHFSEHENQSVYPDLLNVQIQAYKDFLQEEIAPENRGMKGLQQAFHTNFPIDDASNIFQLEFLEYSIDRPKYTEDECRERELTFAKPQVGW